LKKSFIEDSSMTADEFRNRTRAFAVRVIKLVEALPGDVVGRELGRQLVRSATSVAANYRAACRARSKAEFAAKIGIAEEEADESLFWLELLCEVGQIKAQRVGGLMREADEIVAMLAASRKRARQAIGNRQSSIGNQART
jgi:four helix bundle protein